MRALILTLLAACSINVDYTGTYYKCNADGTCPSGFACMSDVCVPGEPAPPACSTHVTAGTGHSCAIREDGTAWCWGQNDYGQLGDSTATDSSLPVKVSGLTMPNIAIGAGNVYSCALDMTGAVWCWGHNDHGQLGVPSGDNRVAAQVPGITGAKQIAVGLTHACALLGDGTISCWGNNGHGELGDGSTTDHGPMIVPGLSNVVQVSAGDQMTCAVDSTGAGKCWGLNVTGQLGTGNHTDKPTPQAVVGVADTFTEIAAGQGYSCALTASNANYCWGAGPLGDGRHDSNGNFITSDTPVQVRAPTGISHLSAGAQTVCGLDPAGNEWCWGYNGDDRIGDGSYSNQFQPVQSSFVDVVETSVNGSHMCAVDKRGSIRCAGYNRRGELGNGVRLTQGAPQLVPGLTTVKALAAGDNHTCALLADGTVKCWGGNGSGQLGLGHFNSMATPTKVTGVTGVTELTAGALHTCALLGQTMYCWGENGNGQLDDGAPVDSSSPQLSIDLGAIAHIFGGDNNTCVLLGTQAVCIGALSGMPADFFGANTVSVGTGYVHGCVVGSNGAVQCAATNNDNGQLGNGGTDAACCDNSTPIASGAAAVTAKAAQTCVTMSDHSVKCWGLNNGVRLGTGNTAYNLTTPTLIPGLSATQVALGNDIGCAVRSDASVACWGQGFYGGIGDASYSDRGTPVSVGSFAATQVVTGANHACALLMDGTVQCWGLDTDGELGDGVQFSVDPVGVQMTCP